MSLIVKETERMEQIPEGVHLAVCNALIDIGEQYSEMYDKWNRKVIIVWELPELKGKDADGNEFTRKLSREYTAFLGERTNLERDLNAWRGKSFTAEEKKGFSLKNILGKGCQLQVIHKEKNGKTFGDISGIMALPAGMKIEPVETPYCFDLEDADTWVNYANIPQWVKDKIMKSKGFENSEIQKYIDNCGGFMEVEEDSTMPF